MEHIMEPKHAYPISALPDEALIKLPIVLLLLGISKSDLYEGMKTGKYPRQVKHSDSSSRWVLGEIRAYQAALKAKRL